MGELSHIVVDFWAEILLLCARTSRCKRSCRRAALRIRQSHARAERYCSETSDDAQTLAQIDTPASSKPKSLTLTEMYRRRQLLVGGSCFMKRCLHTVSEVAVSTCEASYNKSPLADGGVDVNVRSHLCGRQVEQD
eukprot:6304243-Amphidinium_carterae.1